MNLPHGYGCAAEDPPDDGERTCTCGCDFSAHRERRDRDCPNPDCYDGETDDCGTKCNECRGDGVLPACECGECYKFDPIDRCYDYPEKD